jgi:hypothetical protein
VLGLVIAACPKGLTICNGDSDCDAGFACRSQVCVDTTCRPPCVGTVDASLVCVNQQCVSPSCSTGACAPGLFCDGTGCTSPACINTCQPGFSCASSGQCYPKGCIGSVCPDNYVCINSQCADRGCLDAGADAGCPNGTLCVTGICYTTTCPDAGACGLGQVCYDGGCSDPLCFHLACPTQQICVRGICNFPSCVDGIKDGEETDIDCGGSACPPCGMYKHCQVRGDCLSRLCNSQGLCVPCLQQTDCQPGELCNVDAGGFCSGCQVDSQCPMGQICLPDTKLCGPCGTDLDCDGGLVCISNGTCVPCTSTAQCINGQVCVGAKCGPCTANSQCLNGQACISKACAPCTDAGQCDPGQVCDAVTGKCGTCFTFFKDNDGDGYGQTGSTTCTPTKPAGYAVDSGDCDDNNAMVHPFQNAYFTTALADGGFDYNCDGVSSLDPTYNCADGLAGCNVCSATACTGGPGYDGGTPACGGSGAFCYCAWADVDAGSGTDGGASDGGADGGDAGPPPPDCTAATGTATCGGGACPAGHAAYVEACVTQAIGCH